MVVEKKPPHPQNRYGLLPHLNLFFTGGTPLCKPVGCSGRSCLCSAWVFKVVAQLPEATVIPVNFKTQ